MDCILTEEQRKVFISNLSFFRNNRDIAIIINTLESLTPIQENEQIGWVWETGTSPFLFTEFRTMNDLSRENAKKLNAKPVYSGPMRQNIKVFSRDVIEEAIYNRGPAFGRDEYDGITQDDIRRIVDTIHNLQLQNLPQSHDGHCFYASPGRGDCEHFIGLPGHSVPGQHDGPDDTVDAYGKPNGWCWHCWLTHQKSELEAKVRELQQAHKENSLHSPRNSLSPL